MKPNNLCNCKTYSTIANKWQKRNIGRQKFNFCTIKNDRKTIYKEVFANLLLNFLKHGSAHKSTSTSIEQIFESKSNT